MPLVGSMGRGLYEVRSTVTAVEYRIFFCVMGETMVLLHGIVKKAQATPTNDLRIALERMNQVNP